MDLSSELVHQFVKATKDDKKSKTGTTVTGTTVEYNGKTYVKIDGSELLTPVTTTAAIKDGERVTVTIKDHSATVTGNLTAPAARNSDVQEISNKISEFEIVVADKVSTKDFDAQTARIDTLQAENVTIKGRLDANEASIGELETDNVTIKETLTANKASIDNLEATKISAEVADAKYATIENLDAANADIYNLNANYANFKTTTTEKLTAIDASITDLDTKKLNAEDASIRYANIDFSNIGKAAIEYFYAQSGLIKDVVVGDGTITGELVGVTIKGDLIEGNTIRAEKLVIKGSDGLYYKLNTDGVTTEAEQTNENSLDGSHIMAKSITATKIDVKDLVAFDATIGGFKITSNAIYSGVKESPTNTTRGIYMDSQGQLSVGDEANYLKYYKAQDGTYKLEISAGSIIMAANGETVGNEIDKVKATATTALDTANGVKTDLANNYSTTTQMNSAIKQTADSITSTVSSVSTTATEALNKANTASSRIEQLKDSITLSVTDGTVGNTAKIKLGIDDETREASIDLTGAVSFSDLSTAGMTTINGSNITTGTLSADRINVEDLMAQHLTSTGGLSVTGNFELQNGWASISKYSDAEYDGWLQISASGATGLGQQDGLIRLRQGYVYINTTGQGAIGSASIKVGGGSASIDSHKVINIKAPTVEIGNTTSDSTTGGVTIHEPVKIYKNNSSIISLSDYILSVVDGTWGESY